MTDNTELLPCPFCGGEAAIVPTLDTTVREWFVTCGNLECNVLACRTKRYYTEAEAIAAWNTRADYHGYEQAAIEAWKSIKTWNTRATHGTLTAEQVCEAAKSNSRKYKSPVDDGVWITEYDWQAIADELNARAERTCKAIRDKSNTIVCSKCGGGGLTIPNKGQDALRNYCPNCGRKVVGV